MEKSKKVIFSQPLTFPGNFPLPSYFQLLAKEGQLSWDVGKILPSQSTGRFVRFYLIFEILRNIKINILITGRYGEYFALLQGLIPFFNKSHLLLDVEWYGNRKSKFLDSCKRHIHRLMAKGADKIGVFCEVERHNYSLWYGIDENKFVWIPYCSELDSDDYDVQENNYIFTGGLQQRDYETFYHAVKDISIEVKVVAPPDKIDKRFIANNMTLISHLTAKKYYSIMAQSKLVVLSLEPNLRRCPGVITYVSAMKLGKAVVVNEIEGSKSYIINGETGVLVKPRDPEAMKNAIEILLTNDEQRRQIAHNACLHATKHFSTDRLINDLNQWVDSIMKESIF